MFCGKGFELTSFYLKDTWNSMEFRVRRKTSQPAAQPFPPVTPFFIVGFAIEAQFFEHVEHPRTQVLKR